MHYSSPCQWRHCWHFLIHVTVTEFHSWLEVHTVGGKVVKTQWKWVCNTVVSFNCPDELTKLGLCYFSSLVMCQRCINCLNPGSHSTVLWVMSPPLTSLFPSLAEAELWILKLDEPPSSLKWLINTKILFGERFNYSGQQKSIEFPIAAFNL